MKNDICISITIHEVDGRITISGQIPDEHEGSVAGALAGVLLATAKEIMDKATDQEGVIQRTLLS